MAESLDTDVRKSSLAQKHRKLEAEIAAENCRPHPDEIRLHALKREKLRLKDEILRLEHSGAA